jgi:MFS transporter, AAHS family, 4-hydroxybenzoate transporter
MKHYGSVGIDGMSSSVNDKVSDGTATGIVDIAAFIDTQKFSLYQWMILLLCFLVLAADGFDAASMGFIAPALVAKWGVAREALGPVMSAALIGLGVGAIVTGPIADRVGRKTVVVTSVACFGIFSLIAANAHSLGMLTALRFLTGLGLGAAAPTAMALMSEYAPARMRAMAINSMNCGFSFGLVIGGVISAWLIPQFGWQSVLVVGGAGPLVLAVVLVLLLPESAQFLAVRKNVPARIASILGRVVPDTDFNGCRFVAKQADVGRSESPLKFLLAERYRLGTLMLWFAYFMVLLIYYLLASWLPTLMKDAGFSMRNAALMTSLLPLGGIIGNLCVAWVADRFEAARVIAVTFVLTAVIMFMAAHSIDHSAMLGVLLFLSGALVVGTTTSISALAVNYYPTQARATGVAWLLGVGRPGGVVGAWMGAVLVGLGWNFGALLSVLALPALAGACAMYVMAPGKQAHAFVAPEHPERPR